MKHFYFLLTALVIFQVTAFAQEKKLSPRLKTATITDNMNIQSSKLTKEVRQRMQFRSKNYVMLRFGQLPAASQKQQLASQGIQLFDYIPGNAFFAEVPADMPLDNLKKYAVNGVFFADASVKVAPSLMNRQPGADEVVAVHFAGNLSYADVLQQLVQSGAQPVDHPIQPGNTIFVKADSACIRKMAVLPFITYIHIQALKDVSLNNKSRAAIGISALSDPMGRNLQGKQVVIGIGDEGDPTHLDNTARLINQNPAFGTAHGTHTVGTAAGGGLLNPRYMGMAPKATIVADLFSAILANTPKYMSKYAMVLTSNSYESSTPGCAGTGEYDALSNYVDAQLFNNPELLHVFAVGNDGWRDCAPFPHAFGTVRSGYQSSKNALTVGAYNTADDIIWSNSSRGPAKDGRIKPEVMAGGVGVMSTTTNNTYGSINGTSMASPAVAGSLALIYERYRQLNGNANPKGGLIKALACNGADDDLINPGPDYSWGFGKFNARNSIEMLEQNQYFIGSVTNGNTNTHNITIPSGLAQLKVLLYWVDPPASPMASTALINNLDLTVTGTDALLHRPLILNAAPGSVNAAAAEGTDNLNNIEQVVMKTPPSGNVTINVTGTNIPSGPQQYFLVYQLVQPSITVLYPTGNETFVTGETEKIRWNANDNNTGTFTVEYSGDNGSNWTTLSNAVAGTARFYDFTVPAVSAKRALVRVSRNTATDISDAPFTVLGQPVITVTNPCPGYANISWPLIADADSYEVMQLKGDSMQVIGSTNSGSFLVEGLPKDAQSWFAVRALITGTPGRRSIAAGITAVAGACGAVFNNDLSTELLFTPANGRQFTLTQPGLQKVKIRIRNRGTSTVNTPYQLGYRINGGTPFTVNVATVLGGGAVLDYTFSPTEDFSSPGTYQIKTWVKFASDPLQKNDTLTSVIRHLSNPVVTLSPSYTEGFESATPATYTQKTYGLTAFDRGEFVSTSTNGRIRLGEPGYARTGTGSLLMDQLRYLSPPNTDSVTLTFNLSSYSATDQIWLDFYYKNQGIDFTQPGNRVWIRGSETNAWLPVFTLPATVDETGKFKAAPSINITETLANASPVQSFSSSFQMRLGEQGYTSSNSPTPDGLLDDGITFDDIQLIRTSGDVGVRKIINPSYPGICSLSNAEQLIVEIKNYSNAPINNVEVAYELNGTVVKEFVNLGAGQKLQYQFAATVDFSTYKKYDLRSWVHVTGDSYVNNDTLPMLSFYTAPVISSFPYLEGFESDNGKWFPGGYNSSWQWGKPLKPTINKAANGTKAWVTSLAGNYNNSELSYLYSPCFQLSGMVQPVLSFSHISLMEDNCFCDNHWMEYSTDDITWTKLGSAGSGTNWYDHPGHQVWILSMPSWRESSINLPVITGRIRLRMVIKSDPGFNTEGVAIDDVRIFDKASVYAGPDISAGITQVVNGNNWIEFKSGNDIIAAINPQGQNLGSTTVKVFRNTTGTVRINSDQYYLDRNIVITPSVAPVTPVLVRYYFLESEAQALINANDCAACTKPSDPYQVGVTQYSGTAGEENGTLVDNLSGIHQFIPPSQVDIIPNDNGYYAEYSVTHFSEFWINGGGPSQNQPLPVTLTSFTATRRNNTALLQWQTSQELNTKSFTIEKSTDGTHYIPVGTVAAAGNSQSPLQYRFTDPMLSNGTNYYRLLITDIDGKTSHSLIRTIQASDQGESLQVYPNPVVRGMLYIRSSAEISNIELTDVSGRILLRKQIASSQYQLPMQGFSKGTYFLNIYTPSGKKVQRIVNGE